MTVGELKKILNDPMIRDEHEVVIANRGGGSRSAINTTMIESDPRKLRVLMVVPVEDFVFTNNFVEHDEFMEEEDA